MSGSEELSALRRDIDRVDTEMIGLLRERMRISRDIARVKDKDNLPVYDELRERQVLEAAAARAGENEKAETAVFMRTLMALSKIRQTRELKLADPVAFPPSAPKKEGAVRVGYQGVSGAWGEHAAEQLFPQGQTQNFNHFEDVFKAVRDGAVDYGVLPIENSQTGAIGEVYDLLRSHSCYIVGEIWISVRQCLLALDGAALTDIREVYSHPEGFNQCRRFLKDKSWDLTACRNTAYAAQMAARQESGRYAAIGSRKAAQAYGLSVLAPDIMDDPRNKTRFIAIAAQPVYDETDTTTGVTFFTAHRSGALCAVLQSFMLAGINLSRIESRPVSDDKYRFFADLQANILSDKTMDALRQAAAQCDYFEVLGCYSSAREK